MRKLVAAIIFFSFLEATAQETNSAGVSQASANDSLSGNYTSPQDVYSPLYNGRQFYGYPSFIEGHAFYRTSDWTTGSVLYDGLWYRNVQLMYDIHQDELVVRHPNGIPVILFKERVTQFSLLNEIFVYIEYNNLAKGFYQVLVKGRATAYVKRGKKLEEKIDGTQLERKFIPADAFFIFKDGRYYSIHNQQNLFNVLKERRQALQQYRRQSGLRFKTDAEQLIHRLTEHYNHLNP